ncbi:MAG: alpha/beta hydrolase, partial [Chthoniobacterales bacterium]
DGWDNLAPSDMNDTGLIVGTGYYTDPSKPGSSSELHGFLLVPVELMVDGNRDGKMSFDDPVTHANDQTTEERPYRFWVNDDQDNIAVMTVPASYAEGETVPPKQPDFANVTIRTTRDLEDWTRLWISFKGVSALLKNADVTAELCLTSISGWPAISVSEALEADGGTKYLRISDVADAQVHERGAVYGPATALGTIDLKSVVGGTRLSNLTESNPVLALLFEGVSEGKGSLRVRLKRGNTTLMESAGVVVDVKNVRRMYERGKITLDAPNIADPWDNDHPAPLEWSWDPWKWPPETDPKPSEQTIVYVHGWRMTYDEYLTWADTTFKRLFQLGYRGKFYSFHWPTFNGDNNGVNPLDLYLPGGTTYNASEYRAWLSGPALASFVNGLPNANARYLIAHSMGNVTAGSALRNGMRVTRYAMCNSAMAAMAYDSNISDYNYETPDTDTDQLTRETFGLSNKLNPTSTILVNYALPADYALGQWSVNNQVFKPQTQFAHNYYYRSGNQPGRKLTYEGLTSVRTIASVAEAMGYVTQSRSAAAGTKQSTKGSLNGGSVNMGQGGFEFGTEHSAEWIYDFHKTSVFWKEILTQFGIDVDN